MILAVGYLQLGEALPGDFHKRLPVHSKDIPLAEVVETLDY
jgi:hypothetical protein